MMKRKYRLFCLLLIGLFIGGATPFVMPALLVHPGSDSTPAHVFQFSTPQSITMPDGEYITEKSVSGFIGSPAEEGNPGKVLNNAPVVAYWGGDYRFIMADTVSNSSGNYNLDLKFRVALNVEEGEQFEANDLPFLLQHPFPNPTNNGRATISFDLFQASFARLSIYNITGQRLASTDADLQPGSYASTVDLSGVANGVYFYHFETKMGARAGRLLVLKDGASHSQSVSLSSMQPARFTGTQLLAKSKSLRKPTQDQTQFYDQAPDFAVLRVQEQGYRPMTKKDFYNNLGSNLNFLLTPSDSQFVTLDVLAKAVNSSQDDFLAEVSVTVFGTDGTEYARAKTNTDGRAVLELIRNSYTDSLRVKFDYLYDGIEQVIGTTTVATNTTGITYVDANVVEDFSTQIEFTAINQDNSPIFSTFKLLYNGQLLEEKESENKVIFKLNLSQYDPTKFSMEITSHGYLQETIPLPELVAGETFSASATLRVDNSAMIYIFSGNVKELSTDVPLDSIDVEVWHNGTRIQKTYTDENGAYSLPVAGGGATNLTQGQEIEIRFTSDFFVDYVVTRTMDNNTESLDATLEFDTYDLQISGILFSEGVPLPAGQTLRLKLDGEVKATAQSEASGQFHLSYTISTKADLDKTGVLEGINLGANGFTYFDSIVETVNVQNRNEQQINPTLVFNSFTRTIVGAAIGNDGQGGLANGKAALLINGDEVNAQNLPEDGIFSLSYIVTKLSEATAAAELKITHQYFTTTTRDVSLASGGELDYDDIVLVFKTGEFYVSGIVNNESDVPLSGATVQFPGTADVTTNSSGHYTTNIFTISGRQDIGADKLMRIVALGYNEATPIVKTKYNGFENIGTVNLVWGFEPYDVTIDGDTEFNLTEPQVGFIEGATVKLINDSDDSVIDQTTTNANGDLMRNLVFTANEPQLGTARLEWSKEDYQTGKILNIDLTREGPVVVGNKTIFLIPVNQEVSGKVTDQLTSQGIAGATVTPTGGSSATTDENGDFLYQDTITRSNQFDTMQNASVSAEGYLSNTFNYIRNSTPVNKNVQLEEAPPNPILHVQLLLRDLSGDAINPIIHLEADGFEGNYFGSTSAGEVDAEIEYNGSDDSIVRVWLGTGMNAIPEIGEAASRSGTTIDTLKVRAGDLKQQRVVYTIDNLYDNPNGGTLTFSQMCDLIGSGSDHARHFIDNGEVQVLTIDPIDSKPIEESDYNNSRQVTDQLIADMQVSMNDGNYYGPSGITSRIIDLSDSNYEGPNTLQVYTYLNSNGQSSISNRTDEHVTRGTAEFKEASTNSEKRELMLELLFDLYDETGDGLEYYMVGNDGHLHALGHQIKNAIYIFRGAQMR